MSVTSYTDTFLFNQKPLKSLFIFIFILNNTNKTVIKYISLSEKLVILS